MEPKGSHHEEELNANRSKGKDTTEQARERNVGVERLLGNVSRDLVGLGRDLDLLRAGGL